MECYRAGMTLYMNEVERFIPAVNRLVRRVATDLGIPFDHCGGDLIASKPGAGASMHFDSDDGFNIQIRGRKRWRTAPNRWVAHPLVSYGVGFADIGRQLSAHASGPMPDRMPAGSRTHYVRPGSVVYLPRGTWHETQVVGRDESLALVVNLRVPNWADRVIEALSGVCCRGHASGRPRSRGTRPAAARGRCCRRRRGTSRRSRRTSSSRIRARICSPSSLRPRTSGAR